MYQRHIENREAIPLQLVAGNYGYSLIGEQWNAMLADEKISEWGAPLILRLLELVDSMSNKDDTMRIYKSHEWAEIVARRGPAEGAWLAICPKCGLKNIDFGTSGFVDEYYTVDYKAKTVTWQSVYPDGAPERDESICNYCNTKLPKANSVSIFEAVKDFTVIRK